MEIIAVIWVSNHAKYLISHKNKCYVLLERHDAETEDIVCFTVFKIMSHHEW